ncbi:MAG: DUF2332 family protein [Burkholderiaceae bacterium]
MVKPRPKPASGSNALQAAFARQAIRYKELGSPFNQLVCDLFASQVMPHGPVSAMLNSWPHDPNGRDTVGSQGNAHELLPLQMTAALHGLVLDNKSSTLTQLYPTNNPDHAYQLPTADNLWSAISEALREHKLYFLSRLQLTQQTSDVGQAAIVLCGVLQAVMLTGKHTVRLSELQASAGLNLLPDYYSIHLAESTHGPPDSPVKLTPDWSGNPPPTPAYKIIGRAGSDPSPLAAKNKEHRTRLLSYLCPDQHHRLATCRAAMRIAASVDPGLQTADPVTWLAARLAQPLGDAVHLVFFTDAGRRLDAITQKQCLDVIETAARRATEQSPLAWFRLEPDSENPEGSSIFLTVWPAGKSHLIGRTNPQGDWIHWNL